MDNQAPLYPLIPEWSRPADRKAARMAARRGAPASGRKASHDWQAGSGIVDQMLAYSDWWNIPATRPRNPGRA